MFDKFVKMGCDYYIGSELVIKYYDKNGILKTILTDQTQQKGYIYNYIGEDSDDDDETSYNKFNDEIERRIQNNTFNKILFENGEWGKESYELKYKKYLMKTYEDIVQFYKIYKRYYGWKRE